MTTMSTPHDTGRSAMPTVALGAGQGRIVMDQVRDYARIEQAIAYLDTHHCEQPLLTVVARISFPNRSTGTRAWSAGHGGR